MEALSKNKIKWIRSLRLKKNRDVENKFVVEGEKMVLELAEANPELIVFICSTEDIQFKCESYKVDAKTMNQLSSLKTPNKHLAIVKKPEFDNPSDNFIVALDGIQDPGNLGTIIRTCDWFGVDQLICSINTVDVFNAKVIQSSMGSIFRVPVKYVSLEKYLNDTPLTIYGAVLDGSDLYEETFQNQALVVIGNEGNGISDSLLSKIQKPILIPSHGKAESLNASVATGIIIAEYRRQIIG